MRGRVEGGREGRKERLMWEMGKVRKESVIRDLRERRKMSKGDR